MTFPTVTPAGSGKPLIAPKLIPVLTAMLAVVGVQFWLIACDGLWGQTRQLWTVASAAVLAGVAVGVPRVRTLLVRTLELLRSPTPRQQCAIALGVSLVAGGYLFFTARHQGREFAPVVQDEYSYLIQAHMIAQGRLWMPRHEVADAFDTFHVISDPVYASKYFPGPGLAIALALKLGLAPWVPSLALTSIAAGLFYLLLTRLLDGWGGLLGVVLLLSVRMVRRLSVAYMSQPLFLVLMLSAVLGYLCWRRQLRSGRPGYGWMAAICSFVGGAAITRPLDALCFAIPVAVAILFEFRSLRPRRIAATITFGIVAIAPFAAFQLFVNRGITGYWLETPWSYYAQHDDSYDALGWRPITPDVHTRSVVPQKRLAEEMFTIPGHRKRLETPFFQLLLHKRLQYVLDDALPWTPLAAFIPMGILALRRAGALTFWLGLPLFVLAYTCHTVYLSHYVVAIAPAVIFAVLAGAWAMAAAFRAGAGGAVSVVLSAVLLSAAVTAFPEVSGSQDGDDFEGSEYLRSIDRKLDGLADRNSLVLFRFGEEDNPLVEPVYNSGVAWPDDARVIRAHDLGNVANLKLFEYYARRDPSRRVYRYDRARDVDALQYLGTVQELAARAREVE
ncbi:MAG: hypothetical protein JWN40_1422 [Phycisphaerales bacterium]|nr:hypothetical protein [Phycisphaerales bacterium]